MDKLFLDRRVLITGSSLGIGAATARAFAAEGATVGIHYNQSKEPAESLRDELSSKGTKVILVQADIRHEDQVSAMVDQFARQAGGMDVLVNNAGTLVQRGTTADMPVSLWDDVFAVNTRSVFLAIRFALPHLYKGTNPNIVNVSSVAAYNGGGGGSAHYAAAKAAVTCYSMGLAKELAPNIRVNCVAPGLVETRFHEVFSSAERRQRVADETPLKRNGTSEDIADTIVFLASDKARFITGESIMITGGQTMQY